MSNRKKISIIFGTRPEAIKLAPVVLRFREISSVVCEVCVTAQHREMLDMVLKGFEIVPDCDLNLMEPEQSLSELTARAVEAIYGYYTTVKPDLVLVQGDTTTVFCAALAAFYHRVPVGYVEAGLRTYNLHSPWPEEANRVLTSHLAAVHFAPTEISRRNLLKEGIPAERIHVTGNTVIDALFLAMEKVTRNPPEIPGLSSETLARWNDAPVVLITAHRRENFGEGFESICRAIADLVSRFPETQFVYPVHLNPNVRKPVEDILQNKRQGNLHLIDPMPYPAFVALMNHASLILTDSGGIQEEAPSLGKPVLVMRDATERPEGIQAGTAKLVGTDKKRIVEETARLLSNKRVYEETSQNSNPYGDGRASERIASICRDFLER